MPAVKSADEFISKSISLLQTSPATTRVTINYGTHINKGNKQAKVTEKQGKPTKNRSHEKRYLNFKTYDPVSGELYRIKTNKAKELSKLLTALGPNGVQVNNNQLLGFSTVWSNTEIKAEEPAITNAAQSASTAATTSTTTATTSSTSKKSKKKKGKK